MEEAPKTRDEIEVADIVLSTDHVVLLANGFLRLIVYVPPPSLFREEVASRPF